MLQFRKATPLPWNYVNLHDSRLGLYGHVWDYINARKNIYTKYSLVTTTIKMCECVRIHRFLFPWSHQKTVHLLHVLNFFPVSTDPRPDFEEHCLRVLCGSVAGLWLVFYLFPFFKRHTNFYQMKIVSLCTFWVLQLSPTAGWTFQLVCLCNYTVPIPFSMISTILAYTSYQRFQLL